MIVLHLLDNLIIRDFMDQFLMLHYRYHWSSKAQQVIKYFTEYHRKVYKGIFYPVVVPSYLIRTLNSNPAKCSTSAEHAMVCNIVTINMGKSYVGPALTIHLFIL